MRNGDRVRISFCRGVGGYARRTSAPLVCAVGLVTVAAALARVPCAAEARGRGRGPRAAPARQAGAEAKARPGARPGSANEAGSGAEAGSGPEANAAAEARGEARSEAGAEKPWRKGVSPKQRQAASRLLKQATERWVEKEVRKALKVYREALSHWDHPSIWLNIAQCLVHLDRPLQAYRAVKKALRYGKGPHSKEHYQQALDYKRLLRGRLARLTVRCKTSGARVTVNGKVWFSGPGEQSRLVTPGELQIVAKKPKHVTTTKKVLVMPGKEVEVRLKLVRVRELVKTAVVYKRRWKRWMPWTVFGAGLAVAAVGGGLLIKSQLDLQEFDDWVSNSENELQGCGDGCLLSEIEQERPGLLDLRESGKRYGQAAYSLLSVGGAVVVAGITLLVMNRPKAEEVEESPDEPGKRPGPGTGPPPGPATGPRAGGPGTSPSPGPVTASAPGPVTAPQASGPQGFRLVPTLVPGGAAVNAGFRF